MLCYSGLQLKPSKKVWGKEGIIKQEMKELKLPEEDSKTLQEKISDGRTTAAKEIDTVCIFFCHFR